jgi:hypothetical protein
LLYSFFTDPGADSTYFPYISCSISKARTAPILVIPAAEEREERWEIREGEGRRQGGKREVKRRGEREKGR